MKSHNGPTRLILPDVVIDALLDRWSLRLHPATGSDELPMLVASWRPAVHVVRSTSGRWQGKVDGDAMAAIETRLASMPAATVRVGAGPEQWAGWSLREAITDRAQAFHALTVLAERLHATLPPGDLTEWSVPFAGIIRSGDSHHGGEWHHGDYIAIVTADPSRTYDLHDFLKEQPHAAEDDGRTGRAGRHGLRRSTAPARVERSDRA